jgi:CheY-like chemotaxis protein
LGRQAAELGARKALLKISCSPPHLAGIIREILEGKPTSEDTSQLLAVPKLDAATPPATASASASAPTPASTPASAAASASAGTPPPPSAPAPVLAAAPPAPLSPAELEEETQFRSRVRPDFLNEADAICTQLRSLCRDFSTSKNDLERARRLQHLYRKVHFTAAKAGLAECHQVAHMSSVFEALLFEALAKPSFITPSMMRTIAATVDFLEVLFTHARQVTANQPVSGRVLVVDDDPLSNRLVCAALIHAHLQARAAEDPLVALEWATQGQFDVVLLDIEMPNLDGFEVCKRLRTLPAYRNVPVIFVTSHGDFESRAKSLLSGGDDLIAKPVFPLELAVKAVAHLLKRQVPEKKG